MTNEKPIVDIAKLLPTRKYKLIQVPGIDGCIKIQNIFFGELGDVFSATKDDMFKQSVGIIVKGVVEPKLTWEQARQLEPTVAGQIVREILELSGFTPEALEEAKKSLIRTGVGVSS